jgi:hypothetical protein
MPTDVIRTLLAAARVSMFDQEPPEATAARILDYLLPGDAVVLAHLARAVEIALQELRSR